MNGCVLLQRRRDREVQVWPLLSDQGLPRESPCAHLAARLPACLPACLPGCVLCLPPAAANLLGRIPCGCPACCSQSQAQARAAHHRQPRHRRMLTALNPKPCAGLAH